MAEIKFSIKINDLETLEFDNEKILKATTRSRSTSEPDVPVFNAFSSEGTLLIKDDDLSIYEKAQNGAFDNYEYDVDVLLNNKTIAKHKISKRPFYNYSEKTLTIDLGNSIDMFDDLTYEGYIYPGICTSEEYPIKPQSLLVIFEHIFAKAFNITGSYSEISDIIWKEYFKTTNSDNKMDDYRGGSNAAYSKLSDIIIQYPYMQSKTFRVAFSNVLSRAKLSMVLNYDGYFKLIDNEKKVSDILTIGAVVIPNDCISSSFETSIILSNKYDNVQLDTEYMSEKVQTKYLTEHELVNEPYNTSPLKEESYKTQKTVTKITEINPYGDTNVNVLGVYKDDIYYFKDFPIKIGKYKNLSEILNIQKFKAENIFIMAKYKFEKYECELSVTNATQSTRQWEVESISEDAIETYEDYQTLTSVFVLNDHTYTGFSDSNSPTPPVITFNIKDYFLESDYTLQVNENNQKYFVNNISAPIGFNVSFFLSSQNIENLSNYKTYLNGYIYKHSYEPISVVINTYGTEKDVSSEKIVVQLQNNSKNIATVNSCGELLQVNSVSTETSEPIKYINEILNYYSNGLHTAKVKVLGGKTYYHENGNEFEKPLFTMGDVLLFKGYDNESIMNYHYTDTPMKWQVVENELEFDGGACYQNLVVKEVPAYIETYDYLSFGLLKNEQGKAIGYSVVKLNENTEITDIEIPAVYRGLPVIELSDNAFKSTNITSIALTKNISYIGTSCFENCLNLKEITIPETVKNIGDYAFYNTGIETANIYCDLETFNLLIFSNCDKLITINIGTKVKEIGEYWFQGCDNLANVVIENYADNKSALTKINTGAFNGCKSIYTIGFPESLSYIGVEAFNGCKNLNYVSFLGDISAWCIYDTNNSFEYQLDYYDTPQNIAIYLKDIYKKYYWQKT